MHTVNEEIMQVCIFNLETLLNSIIHEFYFFFNYAHFSISIHSNQSFGLKTFTLLLLQSHFYKICKIMIMARKDANYREKVKTCSKQITLIPIRVLLVYFKISYWIYEKWQQKIFLLILFSKTYNK
jgi:hypothetical protein